MSLLVAYALVGLPEPENAFSENTTRILRRQGCSGCKVVERITHGQGMTCRTWTIPIGTPRERSPHSSKLQHTPWLISAAFAALVTTCDRRGGSSDSSGTVQSEASRSVEAAAVKSSTVPTDRPATRYGAARFLTQATFGPSDYDTEVVNKLG